MVPKYCMNYRRTCFSSGIKVVFLILGLLVSVAEGQHGRKPGNPLDHLPRNIEVLTHFGERADISPDNRRVAFMTKSFGDAMVIDLKTLKDIVRSRIIDRVDHTNLNEDVEFLSGVIPTAENLARSFWSQLAPAITEGNADQVVSSLLKKIDLVTGLSSWSDPKQTH